jgi:hypothetical protein
VHTFTFGARRGWFARLLGRNPLVRSTDRLEALTLLLAVVLVALAAPIAGAVGTAIYSSHRALYAEQVKTRHTVTATVAQDSAVIVRPFSVTATVHGRWQDRGRNHEGSFVWDRPAKAGQHLTIWVDDRGEYAGPPAPRGRAAAEGASAGVVMWLTAAALGATLVILVRFRLDRRRHAAWDRSLRGLVGDDGGRRNSER